MLSYKSYYNIAPTYLCELISRRESSVNTRLGADYHQLIMPPISKDCSNTFRERSFIYAAPCEWNILRNHCCPVCTHIHNWPRSRNDLKDLQQQHY